jgi:hypothetical protein
MARNQMSRKPAGQYRQTSQARRAAAANAAPGAADRVLQRLEWALATALTLVIIAFHLVAVRHAGGLWRDEVNSVDLAALPSLGDLWSQLHYDSFPILFSLVLRGWIAVTSAGDGVLRALGLCVGAATVAALWGNARALGSAVPLLSLVLFAISPQTVRFGDSLRPHGIAALLILLAFWSVWRVAERGTVRSAVIAAVVAVLSVQSTYQNPFLLAAICAAGAAACGLEGNWMRAITVLAVGAVAALSLLPYLPLLAVNREWNVVNQGPFAVQAVWSAFTAALTASGSVMLVAWLGAGLAALWALARALRPTNSLQPRVRAVALYCALAAALAPLLFAAMVELARLPTQPWNYLPLLALWSVAADALVALQCHGAAARGARLVGVAAVALLAALASFGQLAVRQTGVDLAAAVLRDSAQRGDLVVVVPWHMGITFQRYYDGPAAWTTIPPLVDLRIHRYDLIKDAIADGHAGEPVAARVSATLASGGRVWVLGSMAAAPPGESIENIPAAPHGPWGWLAMPYVDLMEKQTAARLMQSAARVTEVPYRLPGAVNPFEDPPLFRFDPR